MRTLQAPPFAFSQSEGTLTITTDATQPLPVDLVVTYDDHSATHHRVTLTESTTLAVDGPVRSVRPHPRHDGVLRSHSAVAGDVTFDGEVDGLDIIACARAVGASLQPGAGSEGLFRIDLDFDPRCDVDDSATIRKAMELVLDPADYDLELAASGSEAVAKAIEFQPQVILLDFILPDMRGADVCQKLSEDPTTAGIPVVLISAKGAEIRQAYDNIPSVVSYITKPFTPAGVTSVIDEAIAAAGAARTAAEVLEADTEGPVAGSSSVGVVAPPPGAAAACSSSVSSRWTARSPSPRWARR